MGTSVEVLVEGPSKKSVKHEEAGDLVQLTGRTHCDRIVVFQGNRRLIGQIIPIGIYEATAFTLLGTVVTTESHPQVVTLSV